MTNDFHLFPDPDSGEPAVDADAALITAYLARELSLVQIIAVEERLATDAAFREAVQPIIDSWLVPGSFQSSAASASPAPTPATPSVTRAELDAGWQRYVASTTDKPTESRLPALQSDSSTSRRRSAPMTRVAAVAALIVVPLFGFAQVVKYVAAHPGTPGHAIVQSFVPSSWRAPAAPPPTMTFEADGVLLSSLVNAPVQQSLPLTEQQCPPGASCGRGQQVPAPVDLPAASVRTTRTFRAILGIKHTDEGRVLVNDPLRRQLLLFERDLVTSTTILDSVPGTSKSYSNDIPNPDNAATWRVLRSFVGDSAVFGPLPGMNLQTYLVIDGSGAVVRAIPIRTGGRFLVLGGSAAAWDAMGRLVVTETPWPKMFMATKTLPLGQHSSTVPIRPDTLRVLRLVAAVPERVDTLGTILLPEDNRPRVAGEPANLQQVGNGGGRHVPVTGPDGVVCWYTNQSGGSPQGCINTVKQVVNPLYTVDDWAMLSDGTIAFVRGSDYHIDWIHPNGTTSSSGRLPFESRRLTDADKQRIVDSTRAVIDSLDALALVIEEQLKPWKDSVTIAARAAGARMVNQELRHPGPPVRIWPYEIVPLSQIPDYVPPFRPGAVKADADGNLWILPRITSVSRQGELVYDVVNPTRRLAQRVRLPLGRSIAGFGKGGVVYLQSGDLKNGFILERTALASPIPK